MITATQAKIGYQRAMADAQAAANKLAGVKVRAAALEAQAKALDKAGAVPAAQAAGLLEAADQVAKDLVIAQAAYDKQVEITTVVGTLQRYAESAEKLRAAGDVGRATDHQEIAERLGQALKALSGKKIPIKVPPPTQVSLNGLDGFFDNIARTVGKKLAQAGNWARDNAPVIGAAVGAVVGTVVLGPGVGTTAGAAIGTALGQVVKATKDEVKKNTTPQPQTQPAPVKIPQPAPPLTPKAAPPPFIPAAVVPPVQPPTLTAKPPVDFIKTGMPVQAAPAIVTAPTGKGPIVTTPTNLGPQENVLRPPSNMGLVFGGLAAAAVVGVVVLKKRG